MSTGTVLVQFLDGNDRVIKDVTYLFDKNTSQELNTEGAQKIKVTINIDPDDPSSYSEESSEDSSSPDDN